MFIIQTDRYVLGDRVSVFEYKRNTDHQTNHRFVLQSRKPRPFRAGRRSARDMAEGHNNI